MNVHDAIASRRTVHRYVPTPVDDAVVERALEAATYAPNHKLTWPWRFVLPGPDARARLAELNVRLKSARRPLTEEMMQGIRDKMLHPARLIVVTQVLSGDAFREQEDYATISCAIQNMSLSLHADGVASKWSTGGVTTHPEAYALLGVDPAQERVVGFVWAGYPELVPAPANRPSWRDVTRSLP